MASELNFAATSKGCHQEGLQKIFYSCSVSCQTHWPAQFELRVLLRIRGILRMRSNHDVWETIGGVSKMEIKRAGSQPSTKGPSDWFTGTVRVDPLFQPHRSRTDCRRHCNVRTGSAHCMAYTSARSETHCNRRIRAGPTLGRSDRRDSPWRRDLVRARREALARCRSDYGDDPHRYSGATQWQGR